MDHGVRSQSGRRDGIGFAIDLNGQPSTVAVLIPAVLAQGWQAVHPPFRRGELKDFSLDQVLNPLFVVNLRFQFSVRTTILCWLWLAVAVAATASPWRSTLYPENWTPAANASFATTKFIQDFSYAGYKRGEEPIPNIAGPVFDVTNHGADPTGATDSTVAIQNAIDAAAAAGGGVVFLPAGEFRVSPQGSNSFALRISTSNIVLRGAGAAATFLLNTSHTMRDRSVILVSPPSTSLGTTRNITSDLTGPTRRIPVESAGSFAPGNIVRIQWSFSDAWIGENNQQTWWNGTNGRPSNATYFREVVATNAAEGWIEIDVPTRYTMKTRDSAHVRTISGLARNIGIESLSIGNLQHPGTGWAEGDYDDPTKAAYDAHNSWLVRFSNVRDSWISGIHSRRAASNSSTCHLLSNGISLVGCLRVTVQNCEMRRPQYGGGGGNGYMYRIQTGNECLVKNSLADFCRHGFVISHGGTSGNVFHQCEDRETQRATGSSGSYTTSGSGSDNHMHFSHSNLWDRCHAHNSFFTAHHRTTSGTTPHGVTSAHAVYWNTTGSGTRYNDIVRSEQLNYGYVIGTSGTKNGATNPTGGNTAPADHLEGIGQGADMAVPSLYLDQYAKRMQGVLVSMERETTVAPSSAHPLNALVYAYGSGPVLCQWSQISGPTAAVFGDSSSPVTTVSLPAKGTYVLELSAGQGTRSASARTTVRVGEAVPHSLSHFIRGGSQDPVGKPLGYFTSTSDIAGTSGNSGTRDDRNQILGYALPTLPLGSTLDSASLRFEITQAFDNTGAANLPDLHAYLLDTPDPTASGTAFFHHGSSDSSSNVKWIGTTSVTIGGTSANDFAPGEQVRSFTLTGAALDLLRSYYNGHVPVRGTAYLRFNLGEDPALDNLRRYRINAAAGGSSLVLVPSSVSTHAITYDGNGATGGVVPADPHAYVSGSSATVLGAGNLVKSDHYFTGWNTAADGGGAAYQAGSAMVITADTTLHAQWTPKLVPTVDPLPTAATITEGQTLAAATLSGGGASVPGSFGYNNPSAVPPRGGFPADVTFTPADTALHRSVQVSVNVTVRTAFEAWAGEGAAFNGDANADGLADGLAWLLGAADPAQNAGPLLPTAIGNNGALEVDFRMPNLAKRGSGVLYLQHGTSLGAWTAVTIPEESETRGGVDFTITPEGDLNRVKATVPGGAGRRVFARLSGGLATTP